MGAASAGRLSGKRVHGEVRHTDGSGWTSSQDGPSWEQDQGG